MTTKNQSSEFNPYAVRDHEFGGVDGSTDQVAVAQLFNTVGSELTTVDHHSIGDSHRRAQRLDKAVVEQITNPSAPSPSVAPLPGAIDEPMPDAIPLPKPLSVREQALPVETPVEPSLSVKNAPEPVDLQPIINRIDALEDKLHIHFDKLDSKISSVVDLYSDILNKLTTEGREIIIRTDRQQTSEDIN